MAINAADFMDASDSFLRKVESSGLVSKRELEGVRRDMARGMKADARGGAQAMQTARIGNAKVLVPNSQSLRDLNLATERSRRRMSNFRLAFLSPSQVEALRAGQGDLPENPREFIRHSRRLARHAREFLARIQELEPDLEEEVNETLLQLEDANMDLLKLEVKSFTRLKETLVRGAAGRKRRSDVLKEIESFDLNRNLWNLSLLEHPKATVRSLMANASERMASRATTNVSQIPKRAHVLVGVPPGAAETMSPNGRTAQLAWRVMSSEQLESRQLKTNADRQASPSSWRGLGLGYNTAEWYMPIPPETLPEVRKLAAARRSELLAKIEEETL